MQLTNDEKRILAQTIMGEAGGEPLSGKIAVASVIRNRVNATGFPSDPVSVALQKKQFSAWNKGKGGNNPGRFSPGSPGYSDAMRAVEAVFERNAPDPTAGATHYWAPRGMGGGKDPYWAKSEQTPYGRVKIGNHVFLAKSDPSRASSAVTEIAAQYGNGKRGNSAAISYAPVPSAYKYRPPVPEKIDRVSPGIPPDRLNAPQSIGGTLAPPFVGQAPAPTVSLPSYIAPPQNRPVTLAQVQRDRQRIRQEDHNPAALEALRNGRSTYTKESTGQLIPTVSMSGRVRKTYGD